MMAFVHSSEQKNNLELYLNDVYEKECVFKIEQEEVEFIQTGIETLVQDLVDKIIGQKGIDASISEHLHMDMDRDRDEDSEDTYYEKNLAEVYFPTQSDCSFQRYVAENESSVKSVKSTIIKVGSFYDGTRNNFPNEFDFIFLLLGLRIFPDKHLPYIALYIIKQNVEEAIDAHGMSLHYASLCEKHQVTRQLDFEKYMDKHGPAYKLQFIYNNGFGEQRPIHVDLVPACKFIDIGTQELFKESFSRCVEPKTFREEILSAKSCLFVEGEFAFTEIEQHFMKNILSKKHVKVYRILKYLLNGHGDDEECKERSDHHVWSYKSYFIKIFIIYHHESCTNTDIEDLGPCVLHVLQELSKYDNKSSFPNFHGCVFIIGDKLMLPCLKSTIPTLQLMQTSKNSYNYERDKIKSVSRQYLERKGRRRCCVIF